MLINAGHILAIMGRESEAIDLLLHAINVLCVDDIWRFPPYEHDMYAQTLRELLRLLVKANRHAIILFIEWMYTRLFL